VRGRNKEVLVELVKHDSVSLDGIFDESYYADLLQIIDEARTRRAQVSNLAANIQRGTSGLNRGSNPTGNNQVGASQLSEGSNLTANNQSGASRLSEGSNQSGVSSLSSALGSTPSLNDDGSNPTANNQTGASSLSSALGSALSLNEDDSVSECRERCTKELEELRKNQTERVQLLLQQHEEKEEAVKAENEKKEQELKKENLKKVEKVKVENERVLSLVLEENESQEVLMLAKHDGEERAAKKAEELKSERNASAPRQLPQIPECPVCFEEMAPPTRIFQCRNGHLICETCKTGLNPCICPKCRQEMTGRATDMEAFLRSLQ